MVAVALTAVLCYFIAKQFPRPSIRQSTLTDNVRGLTYRHSHLGFALDAVFSNGSGKTKSGNTIHWVSWIDGHGGGELLEFEEGEMRLRSGDQDYGTIARGDIVDFGLGGIRVNGVERKSVFAGPGHEQPRWSPPNSLVPASLVIPGRTSK